MTLLRPAAILSLVGLIVGVSVEVLWYPDIASLVTRFLLREGGPASGIVFYRDAYVLPAAIAFAISAAAVILYGERRQGKWRRRVHYGVWAADLLLLAFSLFFYLRAVSAAETYGKSGSRSSRLAPLRPRS